MKVQTILLSTVLAFTAVQSALAESGPKIHLLNPFAADEFWQGCSAGTFDDGLNLAREPRKARLIRPFRGIPQIGVFDPPDRPA